MKSSLKSFLLPFFFWGGGMVILGARPLEEKNLLETLFEVLVFRVSVSGEDNWNSSYYMRKKKNPWIRNMQSKWLVSEHALCKSPCLHLN